MIYDSLEYLHCYHAVHPLLPVVSEFIAAHSLDEFDPGTYSLGRNVSCGINCYTPHDAKLKTLECHKRYIDVQIVLAGVELAGFARRSACTVTEVYNAETDCMFVSGEPDFCTLQVGVFALFFPHDAHMPGVHHGSGTGEVKKAVFKVPVTDGLLLSR